METVTAPSFADVVAANEALQGVAMQTPCVRSRGISEITNSQVTLKFENLQHTGSFKMRGAYVKLQSLSAAERAAGVIAASAGNHAQGVAYHGASLGIATTIVMPKTSPYTKVRRTESHGARVVLSGNTFAEAAEHAQELAAREHLTMIHPYNDPHVVAGQGTVALEMLQAQPHYDAIIVPVGGGGLIAGMALAIKELSPHTHVIGVRVQRSEAPTLAEGIAVKEVGALNAPLMQELVDDVLLVNEPVLERAVYLLLEEEKIVVEGAGAAGLAAMLRYPEAFVGKHVGLPITGGNIDSGLLASVILRARFREGQVARLRVQIVDSPGALAQISNLLAEHHANVVDVAHHRAFSDMPAKCAELDFTIEMRHPRDLESILRGLRKAAFETTVLSGGSASGF